MNARRFDHLVQRWRTVAAGLPDPRTGENCSYSMADIALSAFAVFFTQCPSFLSFQQNMEKAHGRNNGRSLFRIERIRCDNHIRQTLDPVEASELFGLFDDLHKGFDETGLLQAMRAVKNTRLIALDATSLRSSGAVPPMVTLPALSTHRPSVWLPKRWHPCTKLASPPLEK